jgi:hypothetical protein
MSQGRPPAVVLVLIKTLADVVEHTLQVRRQDEHLVVFEEPFRNIGVAGIPMEPRAFLTGTTIESAIGSAKPSTL